MVAEIIKSDLKNEFSAQKTIGLPILVKIKATLFFNRSEPRLTTRKFRIFSREIITGEVPLTKKYFLLVFYQRYSNSKFRFYGT